MKLIGVTQPRSENEPIQNFKKKAKDCIYVSNFSRDRHA
jgi:hypothetical protein